MQSESELYEPVKQFLKSLGMTVRGEVRNCDLVAYTDEHSPPVIVELKKRISLPLLVQGMQRLKLGGRVYVAVPYTPRSRKRHGYTWNDLANLCRKLGFGLITVQTYKRRPPRVEVRADPPEGKAPPSPSSTRLNNRLKKEFFARTGDYNIGGVSRRPIVTAYRESALHIAYLLQQNGPARVSALREQSEEPKTQRILADNYYGWFERVKRGTYTITTSGQQALDQYRDVVQQRLAEHSSSYETPVERER